MMNEEAINTICDNISRPIRAIEGYHRYSTTHSLWKY
jgi:hypothetical protein